MSIQLSGSSSSSEFSLRRLRLPLRPSILVSCIFALRPKNVTIHAILPILATITAGMDRQYAPFHHGPTQKSLCACIFRNKPPEEPEDLVPSFCKALLPVDCTFEVRLVR